MKCQRIVLLVLAYSILFMQGCSIRNEDGSVGQLNFNGMSYDYGYLERMKGGGKYTFPLQVVNVKEDFETIKNFGSLAEAENFQSYFPDDVQAGKKLDSWWKSPLKNIVSDRKALDTVRKGWQRTTESKIEILRWVRDRYGYPAFFNSKESLKGYWLMYYATFSPDSKIRKAAAEYGIGHHFKWGIDCNEVYRRLTQLTLKGDFSESKLLEKIKDCSSFPNCKSTEIVKQTLREYLNSPEANVREQAIDLLKQIENNK